jgi:hypothetical protein
MGLGKRGMEDKLMFVIWEVIVIVMVVLVLTLAVKGIASNNTYWKRYHSTDLALMSDLALTNQGDFIINYDLKDIRKNYVSKILNIKPLVFQILLKTDSFFVYSNSIDEDRFPKSFIFAKDKASVTVIESNSTNDCIVLTKQGPSLSIGSSSNSLGITCPTTDTKKDKTNLIFEVVSTPNIDAGTVQYLKIALNSGPQIDSELLIILTKNLVNKTVIYYDASSVENQEKSEKMSCLIKKKGLEINPELNIDYRAYDNKIDNYIASIDKSQYVYWIVIDTDGLSNEELANIVRGAIDEYYGK